MKLNQVFTALKSAHAANMNVMLWGPPGVGKTTMARDLAQQLNMRLIHVHAPLTDLLDLKGALSVDNGEARFLPLAQWPKQSDQPVLVLIDEIVQAVPAIQNGFSQLLLENEMGELKLPAGSFVIGTGNRLEDKAATHRMPSHITNRVVHLYLDTDHDSWFEWACDHQVHPMILGFAKWRPELLYTFDPAKAQQPYATYRSWMQADAILKTDPPESIRFDLVKGVLGEGVALEFIAFWKLYSQLPDLDYVLANPDTAPVPTDVGQLYAISSALAHRVQTKSSKNYFAYLQRLPAEFGVMSVKMAVQINKGLSTTKPFIEWAMANKEVIL